MPFIMFRKMCLKCNDSFPIDSTCVNFHSLVTY